MSACMLSRCHSSHAISNMPSRTPDLHNSTDNNGRVFVEKGLTDTIYNYVNLTTHWDKSQSLEQIQKKWYMG